MHLPAKLEFFPRFSSFWYAMHSMKCRSFSSLGCKTWWWIFFDCLYNYDCFGWISHFINGTCSWTIFQNWTSRSLWKHGTTFPRFGIWNHSTCHFDQDILQRYHVLVHILLFCKFSIPTTMVLWVSKSISTIMLKDKLNVSCIQNLRVHYSFFRTMCLL